MSHITARNIPWLHKDNLRKRKAGRKLKVMLRNQLFKNAVNRRISNRAAVHELNEHHLPPVLTNIVSGYLGRGFSLIGNHPQLFNHAISQPKMSGHGFVYKSTPANKKYLTTIGSSMYGGINR